MEQIEDAMRDSMILTRPPRMDKKPFSGKYRWLYLAALSMALALYSSAILYPGTLTNGNVSIGPIRGNFIGIILAFTAPTIAAYVWLDRKRLSPGLLDVFILVTIFYITGRGLIAARQADETGLLIVAYSGYALTLYYGMAVLGQWWLTIKTLFIVTLVIGVIVAGYAMLEFFARSNLLYGDIIGNQVPEPGWGYHRSGSTLGHPVVLGLFLVQIAPLYIFSYFRAGSRGPRIAFIASIVLIALALEVTFTRGAWITASILSAAGIGWVFLRHRELRKPTVMIMSAVAISIIIFTFLNTDVVMTGTLSKARRHESVTPRLYMWSKVPNAFLENPIIGAGMMRGVDEIYRLEAPPERWDKPPNAIDNIYLTMLVEEGILGSLLALMALALIIHQAIKLILSGGAYGTIALLLTISISAVFIDGFTFESMLNWPNMVLFWLCAGLLRSLAEGKKRHTLQEKQLNE